MMSQVRRAESLVEAYLVSSQDVTGMRVYMSISVVAILAELAFEPFDFLSRLRRHGGSGESQADPSSVDQNRTWILLSSDVVGSCKFLHIRPVSVLGIPPTPLWLTPCGLRAGE